LVLGLSSFLIYVFNAINLLLSTDFIHSILQMWNCIFI
jgi:hypothetical protein